MRKSTLTIYATLILFAGASAALAEAPGRRTDELMQKSGLWKQVGQYHDQIKAGAEDSRARDKASGKPDPGDASFARLLAAVDQAFSPERMRRVVARELADHLSTQEEAQVLAWLSSDLGARFTRIEEKSGESAQVKRIQQGAERYYRRVGPERRKMCERLVAALDAGESGATLMINMTAAVMYGLALSEPNVDEGAVTALRRKLESQRPQLVDMLGKQSLWTYAFVYQDVNDDDLESYVRFNETAAARHLNTLATKGITDAFQQGALELGRYLGRESATKPDRRS
jgi:hypothetical protein